MEIYLVQQDDTIDSIALKFGISVEKLIIDNGISESYLVVGQTLVITRPVQVYTVKEGDTLGSIAEAYQITVLQLLRNNPELANRQYIYAGESLVISYENNDGRVWVSGYTYPFIRDEVLNKTLPYLTYLLILNYRITDNGELAGSNEDIAVIETATLYQTATTLVVTAYSDIGVVDVELVYNVLLNPQLQDTLIENLLGILNTKNYRGVNLAIQLINESNQQLFLNYIYRVVNKLKPEGYEVFLTLNPGLKVNGSEVTFEKINYAEFSNATDGILFLSYDWGFIERPPIPIDIVTTSSLLDYIVAQVPLEKIRIALPTLGYDWQLPYVPGRSRAKALNFDSALTLARQMNAVINYDETNQAAYFEYVDNLFNQHIVWFRDARSIDNSVKILQSYGIEGVGIWNIMYYFNQLWLVINTQYQIVKI